MPGMGPNPNMMMGPGGLPRFVDPNMMIMGPGGPRHMMMRPGPMGTMMDPNMMGPGGHD